jgi:hypothetical protein
MFWPTWPSSGVYDILHFSPEGIYFAAFVAFVARSYAENMERQESKHAHKNMEIKGNTTKTNTN